MKQKLEALKALLGKFESVAVAFSGGVDSVFLLAVAVEVLQDKAVAVIGVSPSLPAHERSQAKELAAHLHAKLVEVETNELAVDAYQRNAKDRCYHCKNELFTQINTVCKHENLSVIVDGFNVDDQGDYRPGQQAANELGIRHPLMDVGLQKSEIRALSKEMNLPTWNKPALACLASRFPYGIPITKENLGRIERIEQGLKTMGFKQVRARFHESIVRIEVDESELEQMLSPTKRKQVSDLGRKEGFAYVALDLDGYRTGSLNEILNDNA